MADPSSAVDEIWPDSFGAEAFVLAPLDATARARAFEPFPFTWTIAAAYQASGAVPPFEVIVAAPSGKHVVRELFEMPVAIVVSPEEGGEHRVTLREVAHNRWWGGVTFDVDGDPA